MRAEVFTTVNGAFEVMADGERVWVNAEWGALGRLNKRRIDVHDPPDGRCGDCGAVDGDAWSRFVAGVQARAGFELPEWARPRWVQPIKSKEGAKR